MSIQPLSDLQIRNTCTLEANLMDKDFVVRFLISHSKSSVCGCRFCYIYLFGDLVTSGGSTMDQQTGLKP